MIDSPKATLVNYSADPLQLICVAAWASTGLTDLDLHVPVEARLGLVFEGETNRKRSPEELIEFLAEHGHTSPFRHVTLTYLIESDIATHIQVLKHRVGVEVNSESARYKRLPTQFYVPNDLPPGLQERIAKHAEDSHQLYLEAYQELINLGYTRQRAKESARYFLPYSQVLNYVVTFSLQALAHFWELRSSESAQREISILAHQLVEEVRQIPNGEIFYQLIVKGKLK